MARNQTPQQQIDSLLKLLEDYASGKLNLTSLNGSSFASQSNQPKASTAPTQTSFSNKDPVNFAASPQTVANLANVASLITRDPTFSQVGAAYGLSQPGINEANRAIGLASLAASVTGVPGISTLGSLASLGINGPSAPGVLGLLGSVVNPAFGIIGLANSIAGNPVGRVANTLDGRLAPGISVADQVGNAINDSQIGYDTESMQRMVDAIQSESTTQSTNASLGGYDDSGNGFGVPGYNSPTENRGERNGGNSGDSGNSGGGGIGTGNASQSGAGASRTGGDSRSSY